MTPQTHTKNTEYAGKAITHSNGSGLVQNGFGRTRSDSNGSPNRSNGSHNDHDSLPVDWERLARASAHPLRIAVLEILGMDSGRLLSPMEISRELQLPLSNTNYHVTELARAGLIELAEERPVRGAVEHFYRLAR